MRALSIAVLLFWFDLVLNVNTDPRLVLGRHILELPDLWQLHFHVYHLWKTCFVVDVNVILVEALIVI